ncbi:MAG: lactoylglutathione lyase [Pseudomonadales bacterium]|nr:lactoylglutathione lyase [Pseudomonadales bacterium]
MEYLHSMVRVSDLDASLDFYCNALGLQVHRRSDYEEGRFSLIFLVASGDQSKLLDSPSPLIELTYNWPDADGNRKQYSQGDSFGHLAFRVDNIYALCERLQQAGVSILRPPRDGRMAFIKSPDGISIELLQRGDALAPQEPWASMANNGSW